MDSIQTGCPSCKRARFFRKRAAGAFGAALLLTALTPSATAASGRAVVLDIDGVIGPAFSDYIKRELVVARSNETRLVVLRINTPGGLDASMRAIIGAILASPVPVATFVAPNDPRGERRNLYRLCQRHRRYGSWHPYRRRDASQNRGKFFQTRVGPHQIAGRIWSDHQG